MGWDCWEVGAGSGSIAAWMAGRVGPAGSVLATDIDPREMAFETDSNLRTMEHDLVRDPLPAGRHHCIHARLVLGHLGEREAILERLASALVPGGWLVIEDLDLVLPPCSEMATPDHRLVHKVRTAFSERLGAVRNDSGWAPGRGRRSELSTRSGAPPSMS